MPKILDLAVKQLEAKGWGKSAAYAIGAHSLQKAGDLKAGHNTTTKQGSKRGSMTDAQRRKSPP
jgi:hypothetical protein